MHRYQFRNDYCNLNSNTIVILVGKNVTKGTALQMVITEKQVQGHVIPSSSLNCVSNEQPFK